MKRHDYNKGANAYESLLSMRDMYANIPRFKFIWDRVSSTVSSQLGVPWDSVEGVAALKTYPPIDSPEKLTVFQKVGKAIKGVAKTFTKLLGKLTGLVGAPALLALKGTMKKQLDKRNVRHDNSIADIANKFYSNVIKKHSYHLSGNVIASAGSGAAAGSVAGPVGMSIGALVPIILDFFKMLGKKSADGDASPEDQAMLSDAEYEIDRYEKDPNFRRSREEEGNSLTGKGSFGDIFAILVVFGVILIFSKLAANGKA